MNWIWNYFTYDYTMRLIVYARKAKEVIEREERANVTHLGEDLLPLVHQEKAAISKEQTKQIAQQ